MTKKLTFLEIFNTCAELSKAIHSDYIPPESLDSPISEAELGLDSLDVVLTFSYLAELYGMPDIADDEPLYPTDSVRALEEHIMKERTLKPEETYETVADIRRELK